MGKVIQLPVMGKKEFDEFIEELKTAHSENRLRTFICIAGINYRNGEEVPGFSNDIRRYWYSIDGTCTEALGLTVLIQDEILEYMKDQCQAVLGEDC